MSDYSEEYGEAWANRNHHDADHIRRDRKKNKPFTSKYAPIFDGTGSWFTFEDNVRGWEDISIHDKAKRGHHLKNELTGAALIFAKQLDTSQLGTEEGVNYLLDYLRPKFIKGDNTIFLWRLTKLMGMKRGSSEFHGWIGKYSLQLQYLEQAWKSLLPKDATSDGSFTMWLDDLNKEEFQKYAARHVKAQIDLDARYSGPSGSAKPQTKSWPGSART